MNLLSPHILQQANEEAIYNMYMYLSHKSNPVDGESFQSIILGLEGSSKKQRDSWSDRDLRNLTIVKNAILKNPTLSSSRISNLTRSKNGLTACTFTKPDGRVSVIFRGTGSGEWIDNGEGLSGIPEENTYITYKKGGEEAYRIIAEDDYATNQQVEALNYFLNICAKNSWSDRTHITLSGHSKGGNKAGFITISSAFVKECYSFNGQGFSPEALQDMILRYNENFENRRRKIYSFSASNDYVNVLGKRLVPEQNIFFFKSYGGLHHMDALLDTNGVLHSQCQQGRLSEYIQTVSDKLMSLPPAIRKHATLGVMNIFQKYLGSNEDTLPIEQTIKGLTVALATIISTFPNYE